MSFHHLSYLQQVSDIIEDDHKSLAAYYGYIAKKIASKHVVHLNGSDPNRLRHCSACQGPINCGDIKHNMAEGKIQVTCPLCGFIKRAPGIAKRVAQNEQKQ